MIRGCLHQAHQIFCAISADRLQNKTEGFDVVFDWTCYIYTEEPMKELCFALAMTKTDMRE